MTTIEKIGLYFGVGVALLILGLIFLSTNGVMEYRSLKEKESLIENRVREVSLGNRALENEINRLKYDLEYIRHKARHDHGMAAPNELIFKLPPGAKGSPAGGNARPGGHRAHRRLTQSNLNH